MTVDKYEVSLKLILKNKEGETLLLKNSNRFHSVGYYDLAGGRIDTNEFEVAYEDILKREVCEELGNAVETKIYMKPVSIARLEHKENRILMLFFEADYISGDIVISDEHDSYKWVQLEEIALEEYFLSGMLEGIGAYLENSDLIK